MLSDYISEFGTDEVLFVSAQGVKCTAGQLTDFCIMNRSFLEQIKGRNLAVLIDDDLTLAFYLVLLDGHCRRLTLLPPDENDDQIEAFLAKSGTNDLVTTRNATHFSVHTIRADPCSCSSHPSSGSS